MTAPAPSPSARRWYLALGYAGLIPFFAGTLLLYGLAPPFLDAMIAGGGLTSLLFPLAYLSYAALIICFMLGCLWLEGVRHSTPSLMIFSIVLMLLSWAVLVSSLYAELLPLHGAGGGTAEESLALRTACGFFALVLLLIYYGEYRHRSLLHWPEDYRQMRRNLTLGSAGSLLASALA
jgi:hypothetical protein